MLCILGWTGIIYFRKAAEKTRIAMFLVMFAGVSAFGFALVASKLASTSPDPFNPSTGASQPAQLPAITQPVQPETKQTAPATRTTKTKPAMAPLPQAPTRVTAAGSTSIVTLGANSPVVNNAAGPVNIGVPSAATPPPEDPKRAARKLGNP